VPHALETAEVAGVVDSFAMAAQRPAAAGFKVLEIQGAHGYLVHQFLFPAANRRSDRYGGDLANRMRFALEVTEAVRGEMPAENALFFPISAVDCMG
jgi:2,4-dienoyl-CoA reductase-like NADH-dependent reductase (Old Yellow Enzyme family)